MILPRTQQIDEGTASIAVSREWWAHSCRRLREMPRTGRSWGRRGNPWDSAAGCWGLLHLPWHRICDLQATATTSSRLYWLSLYVSIKFYVVVVGVQRRARSIGERCQSTLVWSITMNLLSPVHVMLESVLREQNHQPQWVVIKSNMSWVRYV